MKLLPEFIIRTPLYPFGKKVKDSSFLEALYLSSPILYNESQKINSNKDIEDKELRKINISINKYQSRASSRCTPFGLFAGLSTGQFSTQSKVCINSDLLQSLRRQTRLDMNTLCQLAQELSEKKFIQPHLLFYPNNSSYKINESLRYVEYYYDNYIRFHKISKVDYSIYLELLLKEAKSGKTITQLAHILVDDEISIEEANGFIHTLINEQILVSNLAPTVTGKEFFLVIMDILTSIYSKHPEDELLMIIHKLKEINSAIKKLDNEIFNEIGAYKEIHKIVSDLLPSISDINLFQTDLFKKTYTSNLHFDIQKSILEAITFLNRISPFDGQNNLENFKRRFKKRYNDEEIPLLKALDTETGIGYLNSEASDVNELIDDIHHFSVSSEYDLNWTELESVLHKLLTKSIAANKKEIEVSEEDFENINYTTSQLPHSFAVMFNVLNNKTNKIVIKGIGGSSAINLLGRFTLGSKEITKITRIIANHEQEQVGTNILAEIVHLPENRVGNVLARSTIREYEIPYLTNSSVDSDYQIDLSDLYISIRENKIILRSERLNKQIIPRLGNAHNYRTNALPVYQFLGELQTQYFKKSFLNFNWGSLANQYEFLPRVSYKNIILSPATWQLNKKHFEKLISCKNIKEITFEFLKFKEKHELTDLFYFIQGDNELLINTNEPISILTFIDVIKNSENIKLEEFLYETENSLVTNCSDEPYANQCVAILLNSENKLKNLENYTPSQSSIQHKFMFGSEWLYYKIYCGTKIADFILNEKIKKCTELLLRQNKIDKWFFIRYTDPDMHLRFRMHVTDLSNLESIIQVFHNEFNSLFNEGLIFKLQTDTYVRELVRYGDNTIELIESLFYIDSVFYTEILGLSSNLERWQIALMTTDNLLNNFCLSLKEKFELMSSISQSFFKEHEGDKDLKLQIDTKFRKFRKELDIAFGHEINTENDEVGSVINSMKEEQKIIIDEILEINKKEALKVPISYLIGSLIHMNLNRFFISRQRMNEFIIYELLTRRYRSDISRRKNQI